MSHKSNFTIRFCNLYRKFLLGISLLTYPNLSLWLQRATLKSPPRITDADSSSLNRSSMACNTCNCWASKFAVGIYTFTTLNSSSSNRKWQYKTLSKKGVEESIITGVMSLLKRMATPPELEDSLVKRLVWFHWYFQRVANPLEQCVSWSRMTDLLSFFKDLKICLLFRFSFIPFTFIEIKFRFCKLWLLEIMVTAEKPSYQSSFKFSRI